MHPSPHGATPQPSTLSPSTLGPTLPGPVASRFRCLRDRPVLWRERLQVSDRFRDEYCDGRALDVYVDATQRGQVPVIFSYWIKDSTRPMDNATESVLGLAVNTAAKFNNEVILLLYGRKEALHRIRFLRNVKVVEIFEEEDPVQKSFLKLAPPVYNHMSTNPVDYELFCIRRWFGMLQFLLQREYKHVFFIDNDVLLLTNVTKDIDRCYQGCRTAGDMVYSVYARTETVQGFVDFVMRVYKEPGYKKLHSMAKKFEVISDMYLYLEYTKLELDEHTGKPHTNLLCTNLTTPAKYALSNRLPYDGSFYDYNYFQDRRLQLPYMTQDGGKGPHLFQNLHFQYDRKPFLARCPAIRVD